MMNQKAASRENELSSVLCPTPDMEYSETLRSKKFVFASMDIISINPRGCLALYKGQGNECPAICLFNVHYL